MTGFLALPKLMLLTIALVVAAIFMPFSAVAADTEQASLVLTDAKSLRDNGNGMIADAESPLKIPQTSSELQEKMEATERVRGDIEEMLEKLKKLDGSEEEREQAKQLRSELTELRRQLGKVQDQLKKAKKQQEAEEKKREAERKKEEAAAAEEEKKREAAQKKQEEAAAKQEQKQRAKEEEFDRKFEGERSKLRETQKKLVEAIEAQLLEYGKIIVQWTELQRRKMQLKALLAMEQHEAKQVAEALGQDISEVHQEADELLSRLLMRNKFNGVCIRELGPTGSFVDKNQIPVPPSGMGWTLIVDWSRPVAKVSRFTGADIKLVRSAMLQGQGGAYLVVLTPVVKRGSAANVLPAIEAWERLRGGNAVTAAERAATECNLKEAVWQAARRKCQEAGSQLETARSAAKYANSREQKDAQKKLRQTEAIYAASVQSVDEAYLAWQEALRNQEECQERLYELRNAQFFFPDAYRQFSAEYQLGMPFETAGDGTYAIRAVCGSKYTPKTENGKSMPGNRRSSANFLVGPFSPTGATTSRLEFPDGLVALPGDYIALVVPRWDAVENRTVLATYANGSTAREDAQVMAGDTYYNLPDNWRNRTANSPIILDLGKNRRFWSRNGLKWLHAEFMLYGEWCFQGDVLPSVQP